MPYDCLTFDLDGTLTDPKDGVVRCINYALQQHGLPSYEKSYLASFMGPTLDLTFAALVPEGSPSLIAALVSKYRERYGDVGYAENIIYEGIPAALEMLANTGVRLGVCTSKRTDFADKILKRFKIRDYFSFVYGGDIAIQKWQQLAALKRRGDVTEQSIMIGDRGADIVAGMKNGLATAGVLWGYATEQELRAVAPNYILSFPRELPQLLDR